MRHFEEYFQFGGFPECATLPVKRDYLTSLYQKIFLGDIAARNRIENLVALTLFRRYGIKDAVYHYNHGIEVDFVIPDAEMAVQVCYTMNDSEGTFERETSALIKLQERIKTRRNIIVTFEDEGVVEKDGIVIEVIPAWKFILKTA